MERTMLYLIFLLSPMLYLMMRRFTDRNHGPIPVKVPVETSVEDEI